MIQWCIRRRGERGERKGDRQTKACAVHKIGISEQQVLDTHLYIVILSVSSNKCLHLSHNWIHYWTENFIVSSGKKSSGRIVRNNILHQINNELTLNFPRGRQNSTIN